MLTNPNQSIIIALEMWGTIIALVFLFTTLLVGKIKIRMFYRIARIQFMTAGLLLSHAMFLIFDGTDDPVWRIVFRIVIFIRLLLCYLCVSEFNAYIWTCFEEQEVVGFKKPLLVVFYLGAVEILFLVLSQWNRMYYYIDRQGVFTYGKWFVFSPAIALICLLTQLAVIIYHRKHITIDYFFRLVIYTVLPIVGGILESINPKFPFVNIVIAIDAILMFLAFQADTSKLLQEQQRQLYESQVETLRSQLAPHFLFNCLSTIRYLCKTDPEQASDAIVDLSFFLRANLDVLGQKSCISFVKELEHTKNYISLEMRRFEDRVKVDYHLEVLNFMIPPMTLQAVVENAIKHGISKKENGGTIWIQTKETDDGIVLIVRDDGLGFDPEQERNDSEHKHIGLDNIEKRLELMCDGTIDIESTEGEGTTVTIRIPCREENDENNRS